MLKHALITHPILDHTGLRISLNILLPLFVTLALVLGYFMGDYGLRQFIAPDWNRELGFLENLQAGLLVVGCMVLMRGLLVKPEKIEKALLGILLFGTLFMALEELDYGIHYYAHFTAASYDDFPIRNIHNQSGNTKRMKLAGDIVLVLLFGIAPLLFRNSGSGLLRYLVPSRYFVFSLVMMVALSKYAHYLDDSGELGKHALTSGIAEFREWITYYLFLLYYIELVYWKRLDVNRHRVSTPIGVLKH